MIVAGDFNSPDINGLFEQEGFAWMTKAIPGTARFMRRWYQVDHVFARGLGAADEAPPAGYVDAAGISDHRAVWARLRITAPPDPPDKVRRLRPERTGPDRTIGPAMLYLAKILPIFVLPTGVIILLLGLSLVLRRRALAVAALALLWLSSTSLVGDAVMRAAKGWQVRQPVASAPKADAIVVLSGMLQSSDGLEGRDEWTDSVDRFEAGVALAKAGTAPSLVFTGGWLPWHPDARPEGDVLRGRAIDRGITPDRIAVTGIVRNTEEESRAVAALLRNRGSAGRPPSIVLVTSAYHMRRARLLFTRAGLLVTPFPVDFQTSAAPFWFLRLVPRAGSIEQTETALREFYGYLYYRIVKTG